MTEKYIERIDSVSNLLFFWTRNYRYYLFGNACFSDFELQDFLDKIYDEPAEFLKPFL